MHSWHPVVGRAIVALAFVFSLAVEAAGQRVIAVRGFVSSLGEPGTIVIEDGQVDPDTVEEMLMSEDFSHQMRAYHTDLLWSNLSSQRLANNNFIIGLPRGGATPCRGGATAENGGGAYPQRTGSGATAEGTGGGEAAAATGRTAAAAKGAGGPDADTPGGGGPDVEGD